MTETPAPYFTADAGSVYQGDALEILDHLPAVDCVLVDPPYSSGGQFRSDRTQTTAAKYVNNESIATHRGEFSGDNRDQRSFLAWSSMWMAKAFERTNPGGTLLCFTDWRQLPTMSDALQCGGWIWRNIVTWWKPGVRMQRGRFSGSAEYILYGSKGVPTPGERSPQNVILHSPVPGDKKHHIAEKPVDLLVDLLGISPPEAVVLDLFAGSGSTAIACERLKRPWIMVEQRPEYCETIRTRIQAEQAQGRLFK